MHYQVGEKWRNSDFVVPASGGRSRTATQSGISSPLFSRPNASSSPVRRFGRSAHPLVDLGVEFRRPLGHAALAHRLVFEAFALIFVPSSATCPSFASPARSHSFRDLGEQTRRAPSYVASGNAEMVRNPAVRPTMLMKSTRSRAALAILRDG